MSENRIFLIDGHALCYRAFYAVSELKNSKGQPTNAVFGFVNILKRIMKEHSPKYMAVCFDVSKDTKRKEKYADYKIHRPSMPEGLAEQIPVIRDVIRAYSIPIFEKEGFEADDVLATLAQRFGAKSREVVIVTDDKDMYQLVGEGVRVYNSRKDMLMGPQETLERFGVPPERIVDFIALAGDTSDNIPGVQGVGEVTARKLVSEFGSLKNIFNNLDAIKGKLCDKLKAGHDSAMLSYDLATLDSKVPLDCELEDIRLKAPDQKKLLALFHELEFRKLAGELDAGSDDTAAVVKVDEVSFDVKALVSEAKNKGFLACHLIFNKTEAGGQEISFIYCAAGEKVFRLLPGEFVAAKAVLEDETVHKTVYDVKEFYKLCLKNDITPRGEIFDCHLAGYILNSGMSSFAADAMAWSHLHVAVSDEDRPAQEVLLFERLGELLLRQLKDTGLISLYENIEFPLSRVLADMELAGVKIDENLLEALSRDYEKRLSLMTEKLYSLAGEQFNLNSPKQLGVVLFEKLKLPVARRTKTGYSTDEEVLTKLASRHELPALVLNYRGMTKLKSTYIDAIPRLRDPKTGRIHCSFHQTGAETGRLSSSRPNLQTMPVRSDAGREIRKAFVAGEKDNLLLSADYSQIELRVLAHLAQEPSLTKAFLNGEDIHTFTAGLMFEIPLDKVTSEMRYNAKRINFGIVYGMSAFGLAKDLGISQKEAQNFIDLYFLRYPGIQDFMRQEIEKARLKGYVETMFNRRRYLAEIHSKNPAVRSFAERQAVNTPVQGSAADMIKLAMVKVHEEILLKKLKAKMIITVHDEIVLDVPQKEVKATAPMVKALMETVCQLSVPVVVTVKAGKNWAEMEQV
ncbi:MAG: DNA polymerase I [Candidatus Omnitrophica bacterium]|nr:DNA polymerase I [Candidatus Omnitrophota bacterium]